MSLRLSGPELQRLERTSRLLLAPLHHATLDDWRRAVNRALRELLDADSAGFLLPTAHGPPLYSEEHDPAALALFPDLLPPDLADGTPIWRRSLSLGVCTITTAYGPDVERYHASPYYNEFARPNGAADTLAASFLLARHGRDVGPAAAASLHLWRTRVDGRHAFGPRAIGMLRLLAPAFRAGVEAERRFRTERAGLLDMLDQLGQSVMICDVRGRVRHRTPALEALLAEDADAGTLVETMRAVAVRASGAAAALDGAGAARSVVRTHAASYALTLSRYTGPSGGGPWMLVVLDRRTPRRPTEAELRERFGLTPAEARVALLLAEGRRNAELAARLAISPFTARRHTERVLAKLHVRSRAEVAARIHG